MARLPGYIYAAGFVGDGSLLSSINTSNVTCAGTGQLSMYIDPITLGGSKKITFNNSILDVQGDLVVSGNCSFSNITATSYIGDALQLINTCDAQNGIYGSLNDIPVISVGSNGRINSIQTVPVIVPSLDQVIKQGNTTYQTIEVNCINSNIYLGNSININSISSLNYIGDASQMINTCNVKPGIYGGGGYIPQIHIDTQGRLSDIVLTNVFLTFDQLAAYNNSTSCSLQFNNSIGITGNINWSNFSINQTSNTMSLSASKPGQTLLFENWDNIYTKINYQQARENIQPTVFTWHSFDFEDDQTIDLPCDVDVGSWIGFTNLSMTSNIIIQNYKSILPCNDAGGNSCRMLCVSNNKWICA